MYAKNAFVFQIAVTSLTEAREIAANQRRPGKVIPIVNAITKETKRNRGKAVELGEHAKGDRWSLIAIDKPSIRDFVEYLVVALRYKRWSGKMKANDE